MDAWVIWILIACVFGVGEILTTSFFLAPFGIGALVGAGVAALGGGVVVSGAAFILVSVLLLLFVRPVARAYLHPPVQLRTGAAALVGRRAMVVARIANDDGVGSVRIDGEIWTARAFDDEEVIEPGTPVTVIEIQGATAVVAP